MKSEYLIVLVLSLFVPLIKSFDSRLSLYKNPLRIIAAIALPMLIFLIWDIWAAGRGHWSYNPEYVLGLNIFGLPLEEILFFIVIPFCGIFTWESIKVLTSKGK